MIFKNKQKYLAIYPMIIVQLNISFRLEADIRDANCMEISEIETKLSNRIKCQIISSRC